MSSASSIFMGPSEYEIFLQENTPSHRKSSSRRARADHGNCVPIVITRAIGSEDVYLRRRKLLVNRSMTLTQMLSKLRARSPAALAAARAVSSSASMATSTEALYVITSTCNTMVIGAFTAGEMDDQFAQPDGFVYLTVAKENVFGGL